jgi:hypothetical protein
MDIRSMKFTLSLARSRDLVVIDAEHAHKLFYAAAITAILLLAAGVRVVYINALGYNSDEAVYAGQAAALAQVPVMKDLFAVFRAHPLLFQFILALFYRSGVNDLTGRLVSAAMGLLTVFLVFRIGTRLYGKQAGLIAALIMALMPYHVVVTRQVLLDGPMVFFATLTLFLLTRFAESNQSVWLVATGGALGLTVLTKETGFILIGSVYAFLAISPEVRTRISAAVLSIFFLFCAVLPFPLSIALAGGGGNSRAGQYFVWQLFRRPNHTWDFYLTNAMPAIGILVILAGLAGLWLLRRQTSWREKLLVAWIIVPVVFFQLWPTKGFQYLLPIAPAFALLAARTLAHWPEREFQIMKYRLPRAVPGTIFGIAIAASLLLTTSARILPSQSSTFLAGSGGVPGGREMGQWIQDNVPKEATFLTIGPSMANIVQFYGYHKAFGLSVSPNPLHRNPSYEPIINPDFQIRMGELQYLVWDSFSAERTSFFSEKLMYYANKYNGRVVHVETVRTKNPDGSTTDKPVIIIYEVHP